MILLDVGKVRVRVVLPVTYHLSDVVLSKPTPPPPTATSVTFRC